MYILSFSLSVFLCAQCIYISLDPYGEFYRVHFVPFSDTLPTTYIFDFYEDYLKPFLLENKWRIFRRGDVYTYRGVEFKLIASEPESCLYARVGPETIVHHQGSVLPTILDILPRDVLARIRRLPTRLQPYAIIAAAQRLDPQALLRVIPSSAFHSSSRGINDRVVDLLQENLVRPFNFKFYLRNFPEMCELKRKTSSSSETAQLRASSPSSSSGSTSLEKRKTTEEEEEGDMLEKKKKIGDGGRPEEEEERNDGILRRGSDTREKNEEEEERDKREEMMGTGERRRDSYAGNHGMKEKGKLPKEQKREEEKIKKDLPAKNSKTKMERGGASSSRDERPMKPSPGVDRRVLEGQEDREEEEEEAKEELLLSSYERPACTVCTLCIEERDLSIILPCGHVFHWQCVHAWLRRNSTCPNCRADINVLIQKAQAQQGGGGGGGGFLQRFSSSASSLLQQGRNSGENTHEREGLRNTQTLSSSTSRNTGRLREGREEEGHEERRRSDGERENRERASRGASEEIRDGSRTNRSDTFSFLRCFFSDFL
ncbi:zinc c3hc4 type (ring finger) domain-containing protein [Cystoisospora suis]|uniref:Zinc c3hc4 type (Ring finger) domain-containing protein n=1 Tax=Cystoisospora suis TaxID=483139 RepID=A0A2C6KZM6_9APIC|nr:zinc c3hc4 type (ring finger) domain-containing protein [Cystoisospora suis]